MRLIQFENKNIATYLQKGTGIPLVFVHGFCADSSVWDNLLEHFSDRQILRIDIPGFGQSALIEDHSIPRFADAIITVLKAYDIEQCLYIGHSMGGYIGLELAKKESSLLAGLCLFNSHPFADSDEKKLVRKKSIDFIQNNGPIYYVKQLIPKLFAPNYSKNNHLEIAKLVFKASQIPASNIIANIEAMMDRVDNTAVIANTEIPFLFIIGKEDDIVPDYLNIAAQANISSIHLLKDVGHSAMYEATKKCVSIIKDFVNFLQE